MGPAGALAGSGLRADTNAHCAAPRPRLGLINSEPLTIFPRTLELEAVAQVHYKACDWLKLERKQWCVCRRGAWRRGWCSVYVSALECWCRFSFLPCNCTLEGRPRASLPR
ncbi:hypothetical protein J1605_001514 [Eschrichtius robustus]|uniref:Uncharacterized protein n=1 Tax=Eschrichtius robustus TaxID=9764 RepID=A0AB34I492_ESCRO|nr:hypothetical protein J1605_001514 [Eschrichtius robustus]